MNFLKYKKRHNKAGFTLLLSLLVISIVLAISLSVFGIIVREISLSTSARESRLAFYGANTGVECAIYWDFVQGSFASDTPPSVITCNGQDFTVGGAETSVLNNLTLDNGSCAFEVTVTKSCVSDVGGCTTGNEPNKRILTTIRSRGHNTCTEGFVVERGLQAQY
ncbi:MAG: hypothetical protein COU47_02045 [Candidatus Niyogibacteria bacterium CG10_big_fil_rev_8_21_14_0_10_46_36]|uniref:Type 4 fimbrial biogenesis protein PilX N-terminal domain-containing protein n=1 Tax=Candidatus Niyogibacteria bacterium CG10_big_fil_rev_8_21_14_0_10_46_36 TaxID=1974726 RepID=A0A2H0TFT2_9BACT|nr:MAG: hypothetical protein COU47_02045 [Candidatus Niyogibacteria bacterium CG10_big_fil_rev_8_21_14_0_10_46_36]